MLKGGVKVVKDLPQGFYGTWSVTGTLLETNRPDIFKQKSSDIWILRRTDNVITLSNPVTGAHASITVEEVRGNTAIFSRTSRENNMLETETAEITLEGDSFYGKDSIIIHHLKKERIIGTNIVKYQVEGHKISGPTLKDIFAE